MIPWSILLLSLVFTGFDSKKVDNLNKEKVSSKNIHDLLIRPLESHTQNHEFKRTKFMKLKSDDEGEDKEHEEDNDESGEEEGEDESNSTKSNNSAADDKTTDILKSVDNKKLSEIESKQRVCGQGKRDILTYQQHDYGIALMGSIDKGVFKLYAGNISVKEISMWDIISPIEVVNNKCFSIRQIAQLPTILCSGGLDSRNKWMNALESARLCLITKVKYYLPESIDKDFVEPEDPSQSGINVFVAESQFGKPEIVINGKTLEQIKKDEMEHTLNNSDYESTLWNGETQEQDLHEDELKGDESRESLAEVEMKRDNAPEFGHSRIF